MPLFREVNNGEPRMAQGKMGIVPMPIPVRPTVVDARMPQWMRSWVFLSEESMPAMPHMAFLGVECFS